MTLLPLFLGASSFPRWNVSARGLASAVIVLAALVLTANPVSADVYGESGGMKNEGRKPLKILYTFQNGDYEWTSIPQGVSMDFPETIRSIEVYQHPSHPLFSGDMSLAVILPDGSRQYVREPGSLVIVPPGNDKKNGNYRRNYSG